MSTDQEIQDSIATDLASGTSSIQIGEKKKTLEPIDKRYEVAQKIAADNQPGGLFIKTRFSGRNW